MNNVAPEISLDYSMT